MTIDCDIIVVGGSVFVDFVSCPYLWKHLPKQRFVLHCDSTNQLPKTIWPNKPWSLRSNPKPEDNCVTTVSFSCMCLYDNVCSSLPPLTSSIGNKWLSDFILFQMLYLFIWECGGGGVKTQNSRGKTIGTKRKLHLGLLIYCR